MENLIVTTTNQELADSVFHAELEGVELSLLLRKHWDPESAERIFYIGVGLASSVATNVFASWLWERIKEFRAQKVDIEGRACPHSEAEIAQLVQRVIAESKQAEADKSEHEP
ncbi:MAG: hypothetical protein JSS21_00060 [Proteobacteria bacterium]|nr:hypothetical protein [Pseudomonadota bacterium]